ncbi:MAG: hypothetical protein JNK02_03035 [Planctomycetes bacterium]|nr:hypothetical protein [Planctomycetota bacterium]
MHAWPPRRAPHSGAGAALAVAWSHRSAPATSHARAELVPLGVRLPLPGAEEIVASRELNLFGAQPSEAETARLQAIVDEVNAQLVSLQSQVGPAARAWASMLADVGASTTASSTGDLRLPRGAIAVRTTSKDFGTRDVVIRPGECAELDALALDMDSARSTGESRVREFLAACLTNGRR